MSDTFLQHAVGLICLDVRGRSKHQVTHSRFYSTSAKPATRLAPLLEIGIAMDWSGRRFSGRRIVMADGCGHLNGVSG